MKAPGAFYCPTESRDLLILTVAKAATDALNPGYTHHRPERDHMKLPLRGTVKSIASLPGGKRLAAIDSGLGFTLARLNTDLSLDTTFGEDATGYLDDSFRPHALGQNFIHHVAMVQDNILVLGTFYDLDLERLALARYHADGRVDSSFGNNGKKTIQLPVSLAPRRPSWERRATPVRWGNAQLFLEDGSMVMLFSEMNDTFHDGRAMLVKLNANGDLDTGFNGRGMVHVQFFGQEIAPRGLLLQGNYILVVGGTIKDASGKGTAVMLRFDHAGQADLTFNDLGYVAIGAEGIMTSCSVAMLDPHGSILGLGTFGEQLFMTRRQANGSADPHFNRGLPLLVLQPLAIDVVTRASLMQKDPGYSILVTGNTEGWEPKGCLLMLQDNGELDFNFADDEGYVVAPQESEYWALEEKSETGALVGGYIYDQGYFAWLEPFRIDDQQQTVRTPVSSDSSKGLLGRIKSELTSYHR